MRTPPPNVPFPLASQSGATIHEWNVVIQSEDGEIQEQRYLAPWNPEKDYITPDSIANACAAQAFGAQGKKVRFRGISAGLVTA